MNLVLELTKRNIRLFLRDGAAMFFSILSTVIIVALYFLFIAALYRDGFEQDNSGLSASAVNFMVYAQMMAGVLILNSLSLSLGAYTIAAKDFEFRRVDNFLLTPVSSSKLLISYLLSGFTVSFTINTLTWCAAAFIIGLLTGYYVTAATVLLGIVVLLVASLISGGVMLLITAAARSSTALSVVNGIAGTFFGFLCGIYLPYSALGEGTVKVGSLLPYTHLTIWMKQVVLEDAFNQVSIAEEWRESILDVVFSAKNLGLAGIEIDLPYILLLCGVFGFICLVTALLMLNKRMKKA